MQRHAPLERGRLILEQGQQLGKQLRHRRADGAAGDDGELPQAGERGGRVAHLRLQHAKHRARVWLDQLRCSAHELAEQVGRVLTAHAARAVLDLDEQIEEVRA